MSLDGSLLSFTATAWPLLMIPLPERVIMLVTPPDSAMGIIGALALKCSTAFIRRLPARVYGAGWSDRGPRGSGRRSCRE